jgi:drug/metabolite transporter (DMT)-like permease
VVYLILSILSSTVIVLIFKLFQQWKVHTFQAIVFNYVICVLCGWMALGEFPLQEGFWQAVWFPWALFLGLVFITGFNITALTVQKFSVTLATVMQKMSLLLTVAFAFVFYQESFNTFKAAGVLLALVGIVLVNLSPKGKLFEWDVSPRYLLFLPVLTWLVSAVIEIVFLHLEKQTGASSDIGFVSFLFGTAAVLGGIPLLIGYLRGRFTLEWKNVGAGILLGVPNFCSIFFLLKSLGIGLDGSVVFPINNVAIIALSSIAAFIFFREKLNRYNQIGVAVAILSIILIALRR